MGNNGSYFSHEPEFGLCDDNSRASEPAYLDETNRSTWIGIVNNSRLKKVEFYAIDHCLLLKRDNGYETQKRCDGLLHYYDKRLIFVELKDRSYGGWVKTGYEQLIETISYFNKNSSLSSFKSVKAYICNKQRPYFHANHNCLIQKFKDETGLELIIQQNINL